MLQRWKIDATELENISIGLACTLDLRQQAYRLVHASYVDRGIAIATRSGLKFSPFHLMPGTTTFIATSGERVLGTVSLVEDSPIGLPMESAHSSEISLLRHAGRRIAEVSTLCVASDVRGKGISTLLYQALFRWARHHRHIEDLVIAVHPKMREFFVHGLLFEQMGPKQQYGSLNRALSLPLRIDVPRAFSRYREIYDHGNRAIFIAGYRTNLYRFFTEDTLTCVRLPDVASWPLALTSPPAWAEDDVRAHLLACGVEIARLPRQARKTIEAAYPGLLDNSFYDAANDQ
nr:GNAT family N-acetyltransferase [Paraburkholderia sp. Ac-20347]